MPERTVFEYSESVPSPSGSYNASVSSWESTSGEALSQALVSEHGGGTGLVGFDSPRVSMSFTWNGDDELIVQYPDDLPTPRLELTNTTFGPGGRCRVVYEAVSRKSIRPLRWTRTGELRRVAEESLERGVLVTLESDGRLQYTYTYYDTHEPDSSSHALQALGLQGGGETWAGIIYGLVSLRAPDILDDLEFDAESDGLAIRSTKRSSLVTLAHLVAAAKGDRTILMAAVERALQDGQVE